ncbi:MAG: iron-containing alcohol dehydrogenase [Candidatus Omnitrophica bacterium]|nr:iron-containing alcohol dehydrogenase [Candidatus Omnitrophota bacterium]
MVRVKEHLSLYEFNLPTRIIFGCKSLDKLPEVLNSFGKRVLLITGKQSARRIGLLERIKILLKDFLLEIFTEVEPEPTCLTVNNAVKLAKEKNSEVIVGLGGGSSIDVAKAVAGLANKEGKVEDYLLGRRKLTSSGLNFIAIPTTAGTGAEVTPNAVLLDEERKVKESLRDKSLFAKVAIVDPELTLSLPKDLTAYSGIDALSQSLESLVSTGSSHLTDGICKESIELIAKNLLKVYTKPKDILARTNMCFASLLSGIALCNARMGAVHGLAHPLGALYRIPHGLTCGVLLPYVMEFNLKVAFKKYALVASYFGISLKSSSSKEIAKLLILKIRWLLEKLGFPLSLKVLKIKKEDFFKIAKDALLYSGSLKANPVKLSKNDIIKILNRAYQGGDYADDK